VKLALPCGQPLQRRGHGIEGALEAIHAVQKRLRIRLALSFELPDPGAGTPPSDAEAEGTDPEGLSRHEQRAEKKARRIQSGLPLLDVWRPNESRLSCGALKKDSFHNLRAPPASSAC